MQQHEELQRQDKEMQAFIDPNFWEECTSTAQRSQPFDVEHWITQFLAESELLTDYELQTSYYQSEAEQSTDEPSYMEQQTNYFQPPPAPEAPLSPGVSTTTLAQDVSESKMQACTAYECIQCCREEIHWIQQQLNM